MKPMLERRQIVALVVGLLIGCAIVALISAVAFGASKSSDAASIGDAIRASQKVNTGTLNTSQETLDRILDCTTPGRDCYERAQRQTAGAVADINRVIILAAACSTGLPARLAVAERQQQIQTCVIDRLAARPGGP